MQNERTIEEALGQAIRDIMNDESASDSEKFDRLKNSCGIYAREFTAFVLLRLINRLSIQSANELRECMRESLQDELSFLKDEDSI